MNSAILAAMDRVIAEFRSMSDEKYFETLNKCGNGPVGLMISNGIKVLEFMKSDQWSTVSGVYDSFFLQLLHNNSGSFKKWVFDKSCSLQDFTNNDDNFLIAA